MADKPMTVADVRRMMKGAPPKSNDSKQGESKPVPPAAPPPTPPGVPRRELVFSDLPLTDEQRSALSEAGLNSIMVLRAATDSELLAVPTIGRATVANLRERLGGD